MKPGSLRRSFCRGQYCEKTVLRNACFQALSSKVAGSGCLEPPGVELWTGDVPRVLLAIRRVDVSCCEGGGVQVGLIITEFNDTTAFVKHHRKGVSMRKFVVCCCANGTWPQWDDRLAKLELEFSQQGALAIAFSTWNLIATIIDSVGYELMSGPEHVPLCLPSH